MPDFIRNLDYDNKDNTHFNIKSLIKKKCRNLSREKDLVHELAF